MMSVSTALRMALNWRKSIVLKAKIRIVPDKSAIFRPAMIAVQIV